MYKEFNRKLKYMFSNQSNPESSNDYIVLFFLTYPNFLNQLCQHKKEENNNRFLGLFIKFYKNSKIIKDNKVMKLEEIDYVFTCSVIDDINNMDYLKISINILPQDLKNLYIQGIKNFTARKFKDANSDFKKFLDLIPLNVEIISYNAFTLLNLCEFNLAFIQFYNFFQICDNSDLANQTFEKIYNFFSIVDKDSNISLEHNEIIEKLKEIIENKDDKPRLIMNFFNIDIDR